MGFNDFLGKILGNKSQRDLKEITPFVDKIKAAYSEISALSNDELRARTEILKTRIQDYVSVEVARIEELKVNIEEIELELREKSYTEIDKLEKEITSKYEEILDIVLPEAFSIMKDTARRLTENSEVIVTATDFDRDLAANHDFVTIHGDKADRKSVV